MGAFRYSTGICSTLMRAACCLPTNLTITTTHHQHYFENIHEAVLLSGLIWCWFMPSDLSRSQIPKTSSSLILKPTGQSEKWTHTNNLWSFQAASYLSYIKFFRTIASLLSYEIYLLVKNWPGQTMSECQRNGNATLFFISTLHLCPSCRSLGTRSNGHHESLTRGKVWVRGFLVDRYLNWKKKSIHFMITLYGRRNKTEDDHWTRRGFWKIRFADDLQISALLVKNDAIVCN